MRASPGGGAPGCLGNPRSQALRSACCGGTPLPQQRRGVSSLGRGAGISAAHPRGPLRACATRWPSGGSPAAGVRSRRNSVGRAALRRGSRSDAGRPQPHFTARETETMMGNPGKDLLQGNAWCLGRSLLAQQGLFPSQLCSSGSCRCGPKGGLCGTVPLIWTLDPVATELLLLEEASLPTLSSVVSSRRLPSCTIASLALSVGHFPFSFRSLSLNLRIPTLQSPVGMPPPCSLSAFTTGWNVPIRSSHLFRPQEPPVLVIKVGTMPLLGGKVKQRSQQAAWKLRTRLSGHRLPRLVGRRGCRAFRSLGKAVDRFPAVHGAAEMGCRENSSHRSGCRGGGLAQPRALAQHMQWGWGPGADHRLRS